MPIAPNSRLRCGVVAGLLTASAVAGGNVIAGPPCESADIGCFSMAKRTVALTLAPRYETATFYETDGDTPLPRNASGDELAALAAIPGVARVRIEPLLWPFGVVLLELTDKAERTAVRARVRATSALSSADDGGNPVYSAGGVHQMLVNEVLVKFVEGDLEMHRDAIRAIGASVVTDIELGGEHVYVISFPGKGGSHARLAANSLDSRSEVAYAQPNFIAFTGRGSLMSGLAHESTCPVDACPARDPADGGDPEVAGRWYLHDGVADGTPRADINAARGWEVTRGSPDIVVAIIDDGVDVDHPALRDRIHSTWNAHTESPDLDVQGYDRHGTAMAGLVAAVAPRVKIMPVRVFAWSSSGIAYFPSDVIARAIRHAAETAHVLAMGWALGRQPDGNPVIEDALDFAIEKGRVLVFAAGNAGGPVAYPARLSASKPIIAVGAIDEHNKLKVQRGVSCDWGSNFGPDILAAPGVNLLTLDRPGRNGYCPTDDYTSSFGGTSGAAALVAGAAALVLSSEPDLSPQQVRDRLQSTAQDLGQRGVDASFGHGRIDVCRALLRRHCGRPDRPD